jgi:Fe-S cluster assembly protein SufD
MVTPLSESWEKHGCLLEKHLGKQTELVGHPFAALNTAFLSEGTLVYLPKGVVLEEPLHLVFVGSANSNPLSCHPRILIVAEENSQARIVETYLGAGTGAYFTNPVTELIAGDNAILEHYKLQMENLNAFHLAHLQVRLGRDSNVTLHSISLGGALVRNDLNVVLDGEGGEATLNGFYFAGGTQLVDNHTRIRHEKPHCNSHELYKGILDGKARGVFSGRIYVHPGAQKTDSKQTNKNLLLSDEALVNTIPQLEIYADDVKCTHGATIGQLDADSVFYLRSRGIGLAEARELLTYAFASDLTGRIRIPAIREGLEKQLFRHFSTGNTELEVL